MAWCQLIFWRKCFGAQGSFAVHPQRELLWSLPWHYGRVAAKHRQLLQSACHHHTKSWWELEHSPLEAKGERFSCH